MDWQSKKTSWPNAEYSKFVTVGGTTWHCQQKGSGPTLLLLHGSGATTHSFEGLIEELSRQFSIFAIDLPGHGFSSNIKNKGPSLDSVCSAIAALLEQEGIQPDGILGHSAGAAIAVHLEHLGYTDAKFLVSINGAFFPFPGFAGQLFPAAAKLLFLNPFVPKIFAFTAGDEKRVERLMTSTGSSLNEHQLSFYKQLFKSSKHVEGTLAMMANWNLDEMANELKALDKPLLQIIGAQDKTIDPDASFAVDRFVKESERIVFDNFGHLVHEETPKTVSESIFSFSKNYLLLSDDEACAK